MEENKLVNDLFRAMEVIARKTVEDTDFPSVIVGKIIERIKGSDSYKISYLGIEIVASTMGGLYKPGDEVYVLSPIGLTKNKFILGRTSNRTPTVAFNAAGLSEKDMATIQDLVNKMQDMSSDNIITPMEKKTLKIQWETIQKSYQEIQVLAEPFTEVIDLGDLISAFNSLQLQFNEIFMDMDTNTDIDGEVFRNTLGEYLAKDTLYRLLIQEEIRKGSLYKAEIISTNGEAFKNGLISTTLKATVFQGREVVTSTLPESAFTWYKINAATGESVGNWERTGPNIYIDHTDVEGKEVIRLDVKIEKAIVASDIVTIVDLNDLESVVLKVSTSQNRTQILQEGGLYNPDYSSKHQVITADTFYRGENITLDTNYKWWYNNIMITEDDDRFSIEPGKFIIKKNLLTPGENGLANIRCEVTYFETEYQLEITNGDNLEFTCIKDGDSLMMAQIIPQKGTAIKHSGDILNAMALLFDGSRPLLPESITWEFSNDGENWVEQEQLKGQTKFNIDEEMIEGALHVRVNLEYSGNIYQSAPITFTDLLDNVNVVILGSGIFKQDVTNSFSVEVYLGQNIVPNPEAIYTIVWSLVHESGRYSLFSNGWPKYGREIAVHPDEIPENEGVVLTVSVLRD